MAAAEQSETASKFIGLSPSWVRNSLRQLARDGAIEMEMRGKDRGTEYFLKLIGKPVEKS
jgi:Mn-dependent DtxR family transcriptional regulator